MSVSGGGSHLSIYLAHCVLWSLARLVIMTIPAVGKECNLNALPKIELRMQGVERTICKPAAKRGWVKCSRAHFLEAEKQVQLPVARRFSGKQRGPKFTSKFILTHLYQNHIHISRNSSIFV